VINEPIGYNRQHHRINGYFGCAKGGSVLPQIVLRVGLQKMVHPWNLGDLVAPVGTICSVGTVAVLTASIFPHGADLVTAIARLDWLAGGGAVTASLVVVISVLAAHLSFEAATD
jgi:hypothetical protein